MEIVRSNDNSRPKNNSQPVNIWTQMAYTLPRGPCSYKTTLLSTCACYRFMAHPLKADASFDCDGCGHHASFHDLENKREEDIIKRWKAEESKRCCMEETQEVSQADRMRLQISEPLIKRKRKRSTQANANPTIAAVVDLSEQDI